MSPGADQARIHHLNYMSVEDHDVYGWKLDCINPQKPKTKQQNKEQYSLDYTEYRFWRNRSAMLRSILYLATALVSGNVYYEMIPTRLQAGGSVVFWENALMAIYLTRSFNLVNISGNLKSDWR